MNVSKNKIIEYFFLKNMSVDFFIETRTFLLHKMNINIL